MTKTETQAPPRVRGIVCSAEEVRGLLAGEVTAIRRPLTLMRRFGRGGPVLANPAYVERWKNEPSAAWASECPFGQPGDRLYVKETWGEVDHPTRAVYRADPADDYQWSRAPLFRWRPSTTMPRRAARITLEILSVAVERVGDRWEWGIGVRRL